MILLFFTSASDATSAQALVLARLRLISHFEFQLSKPSLCLYRTLGQREAPVRRTAVSEA
jgi:hypothetical protein